LTAEGRIAVKTEQVQEHFRVQVPAYSALMQRLIPHYDLQQDVMVALITKDRDQPLRILDLGCGPGVMASRLAEEFPRAQITLFDLTVEMIERCKFRFGGNPRVSFQVGNFRDEDFGGGYDLVLASLSLHHATLEERPALAQRLYHSLVPDGQLITAEVVVDESPQVRERQYELWRRFMASHGEDGDVWYDKHLAKDHPVQVSEWTRILSGAGFASPGCFWRYLNFAIFSGWRAAV
jgi:tRNA (cmo5U34)-methyltransferase